MPIVKQNKRLVLIALILVIGAIFFTGTAYASDGETAQVGIVANEATLTVKEVWLTGDTLHINVSDMHDGEEQTLELNLRDYAKPVDEYVTIQATDSAGRTSNSVSFKNPYYEQTATPETPVQTDATIDKPSESAVSGNPFTPDGAGTVVDNATDGDGKEFFTVETPDGNVFYLIVDRQRDSENVYLLNAVNEDDLASLAKPGDGTNVSAVQTPPTTTTPPETPTTTEPTSTPEPTPDKNGNDNNMLIFIGIAVAVIGGAAYYFKIVRPKKDGASAADYDEPEDDFDDDKEMDVSDDDEDGEDE